MTPEQLGLVRRHIDTALEMLWARPVEGMNSVESGLLEGRSGTTDDVIADFVTLARDQLNKALLALQYPKGDA